MNAGQLIGAVGNTGNTRGRTGCHLHYALTVAGVPFDPSPTLALSYPIAGQGKTTDVSVPGAALGALSGGRVGTSKEALETVAFLQTLRDYPFRTRCAKPGGGSAVLGVDLPNLPKIGPFDLPNLPKVGGIPNPLGLVEWGSYAFCLLTDVNTWIRVLFVLGGVVLGLFGIYQFAKELNPALAGKIKSVGTLVATKGMAS